MKILLSLLVGLSGSLVSVVHAQGVYYTPNDLTALSMATGDGSVWEITVTGGAIPTGVYEAWCFASDPTGYGGADFGASFSSTLIRFDDVIENAGSPGTNKTGAMVNYVFDQYYGFWNEAGLSSADVKDRYNGFHEILWEIQKDYDPAAGVTSFDLNAGAYTTYSSYARNLISGDLTAAYSSLSPDYTSGKYDLKVISGQAVTVNGAVRSWEIQPLIVVSAIPEPSAFMLGGLAAGALLFRRRRCGAC